MNTYRINYRTTVWELRWAERTAHRARPRVIYTSMHLQALTVTEAVNQFRKVYPDNKITSVFVKCDL